MKFDVIVFKPMASEIYETISVDVETKAVAEKKVRSIIDAKNRAGIREYSDAKIVRVK